MGTLGNVPNAYTLVRLAARSSFALGVQFLNSAGESIDVEGSTVRLVARASARFGGAIVLDEAAEIVGDSNLGTVQFRLQALDLDLPAGEYPYSVTMLSATGYSVVVLHGDIVIEPNPDPGTAGTFAEVNPSSNLVAYVEHGDLVKVTIAGPIVPEVSALDFRDKLACVIVVTGDEARPTSTDVVMWVTPNTDVTPVNAAPYDIVASAVVIHQPVSVVASAIQDTSFIVSWAAVVDAYSYTLEVDGEDIGTTQNLSMTVTGLTPDHLYSIVRVRAQDVAGNVSPWRSIPGGVRTNEPPDALFYDDFARANGAVGNGWTPTGSTILSGAMTPGGYSGYGRVARPATLPKRTSVSAVFTDAISTYQGIFLGWTAASGHGVKFFQNGTGWVIGDASDPFSTTTPVNTDEVAGPYTECRLDYDGTDVTAYLNGIEVHRSSLATLGLVLDSNTGNVYQCGYAGEPKGPSIETFEVWPL